MSNDQSSNKKMQLWLDFFGVLVPNHKGVARELAKIASCNEQFIIDRVFKSFEYQSLFIGKIDLNEFTLFCSHSLNINLTKNDLLKIWAIEVLPFRNEEKKFLEWARKAFTNVMLISDTHALYWHTVLARGIDKFFSRIFASHLAGVRKIDGKLYQIALEQTDIKPSNIIVVDDRLENLAHASSQHMKTVQYNISYNPLTMLKHRIKNFF